MDNLRSQLGPPAEGWGGHLRRFRQDALTLLDEAARDYGDVVRFRLGWRVIHLINSPAGIEHVLTKRSHNYDKHTRSARIISDICGPSMLTSDGEFWRQQRRLAQPTFQPHRIAAFRPLIAGAALAMTREWDRKASLGEPIDLAAEMSALTFRVAGRALFGAELGDDADTVSQALALLLDQTYHRLRTLLPLPRFIPSRSNRQFAAALARVDRVVYRIVEERRRSGLVRDDLLGRLLAACDHDGSNAMTDRQLRNEAITLLLAGHETTANALAWTFYLLAQHPEVDSRLQSELTGLSPAALETGEFNALPFTTAVLQEALRLYPPIWIIERRVVAQDEIGGIRIPAGSAIVISPYALHRRPCYWPAPAEFKPERFLAASMPHHPANCFLPFGLGAHHCIGNHFAMTEATIILAMVAHQFRLELIGSQRAIAQAGITLRMRDAIRMKLYRRF